MTRKVIPVAGALAAISITMLVSAPALATTAVSGALNGVANATIDNVTATDNQSQSWVATPGPLSISISATQTEGSDTLTVSGAATATWDSADSGSVNFSNYGWNFSVFDASESAANLTAGRGGDDWSYTFTATTNGKIVLNYNSSLAGGDGFGLWGWGVDFSGSGSGYPVLSSGDPTQSGSFIGILQAGQTYTIGLNGNPNISDGAFGNYAASMNGEFSWVITTVPEPSTWAMFALGFAGVGAVASLRARRAGFVTA